MVYMLFSKFYPPPLQICQGDIFITIYPAALSVENAPRHFLFMFHFYDIKKTALSFLLAVLSFLIIPRQLNLPGIIFQRLRIMLSDEPCFQKRTESCHCSPSIEGFYHICRTLNISADDCFFLDSHKTDSTYHELLRLLSQCDEKDLSVLLATATALAGTDRSSVNGILMPQGKKKPAVQIIYLYRRLFFSTLLYLSQSVPQTEDYIHPSNQAVYHPCQKSRLQTSYLSSHKNAAEISNRK